MKKLLFQLLAAVLTLSVLLSFAPLALAEGYAADQSFAETNGGELIYTVQVSAVETQSGAAQVRASMLAAGYDCFLYEKDGLWRVMCGKFLDRGGAETYRNSILANTTRSRAYVTSAVVPEGEREAFESAYAAGDGVISKSQAETALYKPAVNLALAPNTFAEGQFYEADASQATVYTVQISAHAGRETAEQERDRMLAKGYDSFVYIDYMTFYVMCGKFGSTYEALCYSEAIHTDPAYYGAYVTTAKLPLTAVQSFLNRLAEFVTIPQDPRLMETYWERPTGAYFRYDVEDGVEVYSVQFSQGSSFLSSERARDNMEEKGYPAFVYKTMMTYKMMTGMFTDKQEAESYLYEIRTKAGRYDAVLSTANVPRAELESFRSWYESR